MRPYPLRSRAPALASGRLRSDQAPATRELRPASPCRGAGSALGGGNMRQTVAELIGHPRKLALHKDHVQQLLTMHRAAVLVFQLSHDLTRLHVDNVAR